MKFSNKTKKIFSIALLLFFININVIYAETSTDLHICEYPGVIRSLKMIGLIIFIAKIAVPLLLMYTSIVDVLKTVLSGKIEDLKKSGFIILKRTIAALVVFFVPSIVNFVFSTMVDIVDSPEYKTCSTCLLDHNNCDIPEEDSIIIEDNVNSEGNKN